ncbi:MAG: hypothetical protein QOC82_1377 [Frankiaceae bacterium]|nr:hypothetical protein [Frankiaceae bacterium]
MHKATLLRRALGIALPIVTVAGLLTTPASAEPINAHAQFDTAPDIAYDSRNRALAVDICAEGSADLLFVTGSWTMTVTATLSGVTTFSATAGNSGVPDFPHHCIRVPLDGASELEINGTLDYQGIGGDTTGHASTEFTYCRNCKGSNLALLAGGCLPAMFYASEWTDLDNLVDAVTNTTINTC